MHTFTHQWKSHREQGPLVMQIGGVVDQTTDPIISRHALPPVLQPPLSCYLIDKRTSQKQSWILFYIASMTINGEFNYSD